MGKDKDKGSKGNFKELGQNQFISFSDVSSSNQITTQSSSSSSSSSSSYLQNVVSSPLISPIYQGSDVDLAVSSKRLLKKDSNTRLKAIKEIELKLSDTNTSASILSNFLPFFTYSYPRLTFDEERKVREQLQKVLLAIILLEKRSLQEYMKLLIGPWWVSTTDSCAEVATCAIDAFEKAIPPKKRQSVLMLLSSSIIKYMQKNLAQTPEKLCNPESLGQKISPICTKDEADECYERIIVSTISSIGRLMSTLESSENDKLILGISDDTNEYQDDAKIGYRNIINESFWEMFINSQESIRKSLYELLIVVCKHAPKLVDDTNLRRMTHIVIKFLGETYEPNLVLMYESILTFLRTYPDCWLYIDVPQNLVPKIRKQIKSYLSISIQFLMPILGSIPSNEFSIHSRYIEKDPYKKSKKSKEQNGVESNDNKTTVMSVIDLVDYLIDISENETIASDQMIAIDVNICEILMLMLLRKNSDHNPSDTNGLEKIVASKLISSALMIIKSSNKNLEESSIESLVKVFIQLTRGTQKAINFSIDSWVQFLWIPFSESIQTLLSVDNFHDDFYSNFSSHCTYLKTVFRMLDACYQNTNNCTGFDIVINGLVDRTVKQIDVIIINEISIDIAYALAMNINTLMIIVTEYSKLFAFAKIDIGKINNILSGQCVENIVSLMKNDDSGTLCKLVFNICQYVNSNVVVKVHQLQSPLIDTLISYSMKSCSLKFLYFLFESGILKDYSWNGIYLSFITSVIEFILNSGHGDNDIAKLCYKNSDNETNLLVVIQYFFNSSIEVQTALLSTVYDIWKQKGYKICLWVILSYFINFSKNDIIDISKMPVEIDLIELLVSAFFNRNRDQIRQRQGQGIMQDISKSLTAITSWNEIRSHVFPRLDTSLAKGFADYVISELSILSKDKRGSAIDNADDENEGTDSNLKSRKWARHVCGILSLAQDQLLGDCSFRSVVYSIGLGDESVWGNASVILREEGNRHFDDLEFMINSILQIQDLWKDANLEHRKLDWLGISDNSLLHIKILKCIYTCKEICSPSAALLKASVDCWNLCIEALKDNENIDISIFVKTLLDSSTSESSEFIGCTLEVLNYCLDTDSSNSKSMNADDTRLVLDTPSDSVEKGITMWYIQRDSSYTVPCTLQTVHKQAGMETYYTVVVHGYDKEIQTEASRLLLQQVSISSFQSENLIISNPDSIFNNPAQREVEKWLLSQITMIEIEIGYGFYNNNTLLLLSQILIIVGKQADQNGQSAMMWKSLFSNYRQAIRNELSKMGVTSQLDISQFINYIPTLSLISSLIQSSCGLGDIIWLVPSLYPFCSKLRLLQLNSDCLRNDGFSELMYFYSIILQKINWNYYKNAAINILTQVLTLLKNDIESSEIHLTGSKLKQATLNCIISIFMERADKLKQTSKKQPINAGIAALQRIEKEAELHVSPWECDAFTFALTELLQYHNKATKDQNRHKDDVLIASSLHYIMIGRPRQSASELLKSSKVSVTASDLLAIIRNQEVSPTIRLAAAKVLDLHYTEPIPDIDVDVDVNTEKSENSEEDVEDSESDFINDTELFKKFVGETYIEMLNSDWKSNKKHGEDAIGCLLTWLLCLQRIDTISTQKWNYRSRLGNYLRRSGAFGSAMNFFLKFVPDLLKFKDLAGTLNQVYEITSNTRDDVTMQQIASYALYRSVVTLPAMSRFWWSNESSQGNKQKASKFIEERVRMSIAKREVELMAIASTKGRWDSNEFSVKGYAASGEITAVMIKDDTKIEMKIKLPSCYPLKNVEVECNTKIGIPESRWKRWTLQIIQLLAQQDGAVIDAVLFWKKNVERELEGLEPCPICYSIIHVKDSSLPTLKCQTCSNKFHSSCLYQWFKSSGKNKCVICQQPFHVR